MTNNDKSTDFFNVFIRSASKARFDSYRYNDANDKAALCRYIWNLLLCESLYPCFQLLEVAIRNTIHAEISKAVRDDHWLGNKMGFLYEPELMSIDLAKKSIQARHKPITEDALTAEMGFGFWTSLADSRYEILWPKIIKGVFPNMPNSERTRREVSRIANPVRKLRNAAMHHHSIWHWVDLEDQHQKMIKLIGYICASSHALATKMDRFPIMYKAGYSDCEKLLPDI